MHAEIMHMSRMLPDDPQYWHRARAVNLAIAQFDITEK